MSSGHTRTRGGRRTTAPQHGTESEYRRGCRCDLCRSAMTSARRARAERQTREQDLGRAKLELERLQKLETVAGQVADVPRDVFEEYVQSRTEHDEALRRLLVAELALKQAVGPAEIIRVGRRRIGTWASKERRYFNQAAFREKHPALFERFQTTSASRRFVMHMFAATPPQRRARALYKGKRR